MRWLFLQLLLGQFCIQYIRTAWPSSDLSNTKLLGLFSDPPNASAPETTSSSVHSRAMFKAAVVLSQRLNLTIQSQLIGWETLQTSGNPINALTNICRTIPTVNILGIVGPAFSREANTIVPISETMAIPTISYSATNPDLSNKKAYPSFHRTVPSDKTAASAIVKLFLRYNWTSAIIIYQNDAFGTGGADAIADTFNKNNLFVIETVIFDILTLSIRGDLKTILTSSSPRIVILWTLNIYAATILQSALDNDVLGPQFLWITAFSIPLNSFNQTFHSKLIGMISIEPAIGSTVDAKVNTTLLNSAYDIWKQYEPETFPESTKVDNYALFAFDATWILIQALSKLCSFDVNNSSSCLSTINSSFCFDYRFLNGSSLLHLIDNIEFIGVSGPIKFGNTTTDRTDGVYYISRNVQSSPNGVDYASVLRYSNSEGWTSATPTSIIIWPGNSLTPFTGIPELSSVTLRIGIIESPPFLMFTDIIDASGNTTTKSIGYMADLIDLLQNRIGFKAQLMRIPSEQTYDRLVEAVANNVYDIVVADVTVLSTRREIVDFSSSIYDNSVRIIGRQSTSQRIDLFAYLTPFSFRLWITLLIVLFYSATLVFILERQENDALQERSIISAMALSVWYTFGTMTGYGADFHVQTAGGRLLCMGLYILSIILVATYTANLASDLTLSRSQNIISGIDDIKNGKIPYSRIGILVGSAHEAYFLREVSRGSRTFYPLKALDEIYRFLLDDKIDVAIMDGGVLEYATNTKYCNLSLIGAAFDSSIYGIVMPKQWLYAQELDIHILALRESGSLDDLTRKWFSAKTCVDSSAANTSTSIKIEAVAGLFLTFAVISILAVILFLWLKRLAIKHYLKSIGNRKNLPPQQTNMGDHDPNSNNHISSETFQ